MNKEKNNLDSAWKSFNKPDPGDIFIHYKGGKYEIVAAGLVEEDLSPCVVYKSLSDGRVWVRSAANFFEQIVHNGVKHNRFRKVGSVNDVQQTDNQRL